MTTPEEFPAAQVMVSLARFQQNFTLEEVVSMLAGAWRRWIKITAFLGTVQMVILLSVVYWTMLPLIALPLKLFADPLGRRRSIGGVWVKRQRLSQVLESMKDQG